MRTGRQLFSASSVAVILALAIPLNLLPASAAAQARPKDATAQCKDGTYSKAQTRRGACSGHGGVATWFGDAAAKPEPPAPAKAATSAKGSAAQPKEETKGAKPATKAAGGPENATAKCKDGTYSYAKTHRGACSHHGGVAEWYK